jgi:transposase
VVLKDISAKSPLAEAIRYTLGHWNGLTMFLTDGRVEVGRVEMWRGYGRPNISVSAPFVWRCLTNSTLAPSPHPARQTGRADFPHPAFSRPVRPSLSAGRHVALERCRGRVSRKDTRLGSGETRRLVVSSGASTSGGPVVQCMLE